MYLGRYQLGDTVNLQVITTDGASPTIPTRPPTVKVWKASTLIISKEVPIVDRYVQAGVFCLPVFLGHEFSAGYYTFVFYYNVSTWVGVESGTFEILAGGDKDGAIAGMYFLERPHADFIVQQLQSGKIAKGRNPA